jgi:hypothetical protein
MAAASNSRSVRTIPLLIAVCLVGISPTGRGGVAASAETSTYVFVPDQSTVVQTGGIAGVPRTYSVKGEFQLTVDPNAGSASFAHVDANATDDSPFKRTLDLNHVFNMTSLAGTVEPSGSIKFTGKASDDSDVGITVTLEDGLAHLIGQTTPPPNSADFFIFNLDAVAQRKYAGGSGTADDPYQIATAEDLMLLGETPEDYDKHFIMTDDIDLDPNLPGRKVFYKAVVGPARPFYPSITPFTGVFDGGGHTILHLRISGTNYLGLFGLLGSGAQVKDLGVVDVSIVGSGDWIGGLVGWNEGGYITDCYSTGTVSGNDYVGGLVGVNDGAVTQCYSTGAVSGAEYIAGLVGCPGWEPAGVYPSLGGIVTRSYSSGVVSGSRYVGGLVGLNLWWWPDGSPCFWDIQTSGQAKSCGGAGKTTAQMQMAKTFLEAGWDFVNVWGIGESQTYPYLRKYSAADINQDASVNFLDLAVLAENWLTGIAP